MLREVAVTYSGLVVGSGIGFLIQLFLQRSMGPSEYGVLGLAVATGTLTGVLTDLGLSHAMIRFGSKYLAEAPGRAMSRFSAVLLWRTVLAVVVSTTGFLTARWLAVEVFDKPELLRPLRFVYMTQLGPVLFSFWTFFIQAHQRFGLRSGVTVATAFTRVVLIASLAWLVGLTPSSVVVSDATASLVGFVIGMSFSPRGILSSTREEVREASRELIPYCRFTGVLIVGDTLFNELDTLMLGAMAGEEVVGMYRAAWVYASAVGMLNQSVANVLFPKVSAISDVTQLRAYIGRMLKLALGLSAAMLPLLPAVAWLVPRFEPQFQPATSVFYILFAGLVVDLFVGPIAYVLYSLDRPGVLSAIALLKIAANVVGNLVMIPLYGAEGAALATVLTRALGGGLTLFIVARGVRHGESGANP